MERIMKIKLLFVLGIFLCTGILNAQKRTVGVLELNSTGGISKTETSALTNRFRAMLVQTESFVVLERDKMNEILKEQDFISSDNCNTAECAVQIGQLLGVEKMIGGDIGKVGNTYTIDMRLVDVKTGAIEKSVSNDFKGEVDGLLALMNEVAGVFAGLSVQMKSASRGGTADVYVNSNPDVAQILIDNNPTGLVTPALVENLTKGFHTIHIRKDGLVGSQFLELVEGSIPFVNIELTRPKISLKLLSKPIGVFVLSGKDTLGKTPMIYSVPIGESAIKYVLPGYYDSIIALSLNESDAGKIINIDLQKVEGIHIQTNPAGARVYLNKKLAGFSPVQIPAAEEGRELAIEAPYYHTYKRVIASKEPSTLYIDLISKNAKWKVSVNSNPSNAEVFIYTSNKSKQIGVTPLTYNWDAATTKIVISKKGYKDAYLEVSPYTPVIHVDLDVQ